MPLRQSWLGSSFSPELENGKAGSLQKETNLRAESRAWRAFWTERRAVAVMTCWWQTEGRRLALSSPMFLLMELDLGLPRWATE